MTAILDNPKDIENFRKSVLLSAMSLEIVGLKRRGRSAFSIVKKEFNLKGNRKSVYDQFKKIVDEGKK